MPFPLIWIVLGFLLADGGAVQAAPASATRFDAGLLSTEGTRFLDAGGREFWLHAINSSGLEFGNGNREKPGQERAFHCWHPHQDKEYEKIAQWGFNAVRLAISWANLEPTPPRPDGRGGWVHAYNPAYLDELDHVLGVIAQKNLPVVLSMHHSNWSSAYRYGGGMPAWLFPGKPSPFEAERAFLNNEGRCQEQLIEVWVMLARRYSEKTTLEGMDLYNEARHEVCDLAPQLADFYDKAAAEIRQAHPRLLLVCQDFADFIPRLPRLPNLPGIVYSFHSYPPWEGIRQTSVEAHLAQAGKFGVPAWVGEIGRGNQPGWAAELTRFVAMLRERQASWALWAFQYYKWPLYGNEGPGLTHLNFEEVKEVGVVPSGIFLFALDSTF